MSKVNRAKSPLFFPLESLETRLDKFLNGLDRFSNGLECLETRLEPRSSKFSRIEDQESSFEYRASRACQLTFERYCTYIAHIWEYPPPPPPGHFTPTVPLSTQVYKWVPTNLMLGVTLQWISIPSRGSRNTLSRFMLRKPG